jgi:hypothetical protein
MRDRTADLLRAKQALSQLSYSPILKLVGLGRLELPTSPLSGVRSNHLSYRPISLPSQATEVYGRNHDWSFTTIRLIKQCV